MQEYWRYLLQGTNDPDTVSEKGLPLFSYAQLPTPTSVRLVEVLPRHEGRLKLSMKVVDLNDGPEYDALSYTWGDPIVVRGEKKGDAYVEELNQSKEALGDIKGKMVLFNWDAIYYFGQDKEHLWEDIRDKDGAPLDHLVECDGQKLMVTENLHAALWFFRRLITYRHTGRHGNAVGDALIPGFLWIDAICINQSDLQEVNTQVAMMHQVYAKARKVHGWLGPHDQFSKMAIHALPKIVAIAQDLISQGMDAVQSVWNHREISQDEWLAIFALLQRLYFRRAWIVQEAVFARTFLIHCGAMTVHWETLESLIVQLNTVGVWQKVIRMVKTVVFGGFEDKTSRKLTRQGALMIGYKKLPDGRKPNFLIDPAASLDFVDGVRDIKSHLGMPVHQLLTPLPKLLDKTQTDGTDDDENNSRPDHSTLVQDPVLPGKYTLPGTIIAAREQTYADPLSLLSVLSKFRYTGAKDTKDKIFAFINIAKMIKSADFYDSELPIDYNMTAEKLYTRVALAIIKHDDGLRILNHVTTDSTNDDNKALALPSFVPDFSKPLGRVMVPSDPKLTSFLKCTYQSYAHLSDNKLEVQAMVIDTITDIEAIRGCRFNRITDLALKTPLYYLGRLPQFRAFKSEDENDPMLVGFAVQKGLEHAAQSRVEALWRTLVMNEYKDTSPAPIACGFGFSDWVSNHLASAQNIANYIVQNNSIGKPVPQENCVNETNKLLPVQHWCNKKFEKWKALDKDEIISHTTPAEMRLLIPRFEADASYQKECAEHGQPSTIDVETIGAIRFLPDTRRLFAYAKSLEPGPEGSINALSTFGKLDLAKSQDQSGFEDRMGQVQSGMRLFRTRGCLLGNGVRGVQVGDMVVVIRDTNGVGFVVRPVGGRSDEFRLIGECYVHELERVVRIVDREFETIKLV